MAESTRLALHNSLMEAFPGRKVYFRPPSKIILEYPCIVYKTKTVKANYANNSRYRTMVGYEVSLMTPLPGELEPEKMLDISGAKHITSFTQSDIVHDIFEIT